MSHQDPSWYTDKHRQLAEAERERRRWMMESSQWPYEPNGDRFGTPVTSSWPRWVVVTLVILMLTQVMWQRARIESTVADELIGISATEDGR